MEHPRRRPRQPEPSSRLYWVTTDDHREDWFVVAARPNAARRFHEAHEGYDDGEATAEHVASVRKALRHVVYGAHHATLELLEGLGAEILRWDSPRAVRIRGRLYVEGGLEHEIMILTDDFIERQGGGRPNGTEHRGLPS